MKIAAARVGAVRLVWQQHPATGACSQPGRVKRVDMSALQPSPPHPQPHLRGVAALQTLMVKPDYVVPLASMVGASSSSFTMSFKPIANGESQLGEYLLGQQYFNYFNLVSHHHLPTPGRGTRALTAFDSSLTGCYCQMQAWLLSPRLMITAPPHPRNICSSPPILPPGLCSCRGISPVAAGSTRTARGRTTRPSCPCSDEACATSSWACPPSIWWPAPPPGSLHFVRGWLHGPRAGCMCVPTKHLVTATTARQLAFRACLVGLCTPQPCSRD
jgi:hypothetical protein